MREVAVTYPLRVPAGAQLYGGPRDGATIHRAVAHPTGGYVVLLQDGTEYRVPQATPLAWLHPAGRTAKT